MIIKMNSAENSKIKKFYEKAMKELGDFFKLNWKYNQPNVILVKDRKTIDALRKQKTEDWVVGWTNHGDVYLLSPESYEMESNHTYLDDGYFRLLKHELAHAFTLIIAKGNGGPEWLWEGIAGYLAGQYNPKKNLGNFSKFLFYHDKFDKNSYEESIDVVRVLVKKYGNNKLLKLIKSSGNLDEKEFKTLFKQIYGFELNYKNLNKLPDKNE